jgi:hypothetical protein
MTNQETIEENRITAAQRYFKKVEESLQRRRIQTEIEEIGEYSNLLAKTNGVKSIAKLKEKHRENLSSVGKVYIEEYEKEYGKIPEYERWVFMESSYFIPGEGHSTCLLVTQALPCDEDSLEGTNEVITTQIDRAVREFFKEFGTMSLYNLGFHDREGFFEKYSIMIPHAVIKFKDKPCDFTFKLKFHYNFP